MLENSSRYQILDLTALFVQKNKEFTEAIKERKPPEQLKAMHSEIQEIYNHISFLKETTAA
jgi:hypothetical protein